MIGGSSLVYLGGDGGAVYLKPNTKKLTFVNQ